MQNILVPVDFSPVTQPLLQQALALARSFQAKLWIIHVAAPDPDFVGYEPGPQTVRDQVADKLQEEHRQLQKLASEVRNQKLEATPLLVQGATVDTIVQEAKRVQAQLIVLGSHGHGALYRALVGSVCEGVVRRAPCPILIVPSPKKN